VVEKGIEAANKLPRGAALSQSARVDFLNVAQRQKQVAQLDERACGKLLEQVRQFCSFLGRGTLRGALIHKAQFFHDLPTEFPLGLRLL